MVSGAPFVLAGVMIGLGLWVLVREVVPSPPLLKDALERLGPGQIDFRNREERPAATVPSSVLERWGARVARSVGHLPGMSVSDEDLALLAGTIDGTAGGVSRHELYGRKLAYALGGLLFSLTLTLMLELAGLSVMLVVPAAFALFFGAMGWLLPDSQVKKRASLARSEFRRVAVAYLRLIAIRRTASGGAVDSMVGAAQLSNSWPFQRIRAELTRAQWAKVPVWDALGQLGESVGVNELAEIGDIMRMAGENDAAVADSLMARAASLREQMLVTAQSDANAASTSMAGPRALLLVLTLLAIMYPVAQTLIGGQGP